MDTDRQERKKNIYKERYNGKYKKLITKDTHNKVVARFRCGDEKKTQILDEGAGK